MIDIPGLYRLDFWLVIALASSGYSALSLLLRRVMR
jgi:hypothetical protein